MSTPSKLFTVPYFPIESDSRGFALGYDVFFPGDAVESYTKIDLPGNYIAVLNSFLPGLLFESSQTFYTLSQEESISVSLGSIPLRIGRVIPLEAGMQKIIVGGFKNLYRTRTIQTLQITNTAQFTFAYLRGQSTPVIVAVGQDMYNLVPSKVFPNDFRYAVDSAIPAIAGSASIDCYHGFNDVVEIAVYITTAANAFQIEILQYDEYSNSYQEFNVFPAAFPYYQLFSVPHKDSKRVRVNITGGGAAETGRVSIIFVLRPRI